ncbi:hypothetical protein DFH08DRAFT_508566 [Mycena albidolilacea]|uniref:Uncharacterized protein n=1 Tax=Mycena albidolilacea TaxID=1033008 RepID=A0AAD7ADX3_9AGAR|nr:hypothetical protein DFH08DRAFT_508566 [Mycena albidolilacea]
MQFTFVILAAFVSAAVAAPATKRQNSCPLQNLGGLSVTASADSSGKTRWDVFTVSSGLIQQGDLAWFNNDQPNGNEVFTAAVGSQPNLFTFQRKGAQPIGVDGTTLLASNSAATFKISCGGCNAFASGNDLAADGCTFEFTDGTNGVGQCITFEAANSVVQLQQCEAGNPGQNFGIFSA